MAMTAHSVTTAQAEWHSSTVAVKMLKRSDSIAMNDFRTELDVLQKVQGFLMSGTRCAWWNVPVKRALLPATGGHLPCQPMPGDAVGVQPSLSTHADAPPEPGAVSGRVHTLEALHAGAGVPARRQVWPCSPGYTAREWTRQAALSDMPTNMRCLMLLPTSKADNLNPPCSLADLLKNPELHPSLRRAIVMALDAAKAMTYLHAHMCARAGAGSCRPA